MTYMTDPMRGLPDPEYNAELYADVPVKRLFAWVVDAFVIFGLTLLVLPFTAFTAIFFYPALWVLVSVLYRVISISSGSATLGMRLVSIELRTWRDERFGFGEALLHTLLYALCVSFLVPQIISAVLMLTTAKAQGLHDLALGTAALNRRR
ncbi:RDD family protein [Aliiruegeria haliotis]|uniref:RDD family protein n=1 Tax=Aliiruegeria haliotis TaxID=1280846 RepID=A0A2T0RK22_9RHOB|nr:RDD family protein [Aliiruegeria haliotis]PRY21481.1 RDD family protein [Aliiruegeria haliotis]